MKVGEIWIYRDGLLKLSNDIFGEPVKKDDTRVKITRMFENKEKEMVAFIFLFQHEKENPAEANLKESELQREEFLRFYERLYV